MTTTGNSSLVDVLAAAAVVISATVAGAFPAAAEQVQRIAASGPDFSKCDKIKDPAASGQCYHDTDVAHSKARIKAADERMRASDERIACSAEIKLYFKDQKLLAFAQRLLAKRPDITDCAMRDALKAERQRAALSQ